MPNIFDKTIVCHRNINIRGIVQIHDVWAVSKIFYKRVGTYFTPKTCGGVYVKTYTHYLQARSLRKLMEIS